MEKEIKLKIAYNRGEIELLKNQITELKQGYVKCLRQHIYRQGGIIIPIDADYDQDLVDILTMKIQRKPTCFNRGMNLVNNFV